MHNKCDNTSYPTQEFRVKEGSETSQPVKVWAAQ